MKINTTMMEFIENVIRTAQLAKIDNIIIEPGKIRAINEDKSVVLLHDTDVPTFPFGSIGLNRIDVFLTRYNIVRDAKHEIEVAMPDQLKPNTQPFARGIVMTAPGIKIEYRCANPSTISAPKEIKDAVKYQVKMTPEAVSLMTKGQSAMSATEITLVGSKDGVSFEISDINTDQFTYKFADTILNVEAGDSTIPTFRHKYTLKEILPLFKHSPDSMFEITSRGILKLNVNAFTMYLLPRA